MGSFVFEWKHPAEEVYVTGTFDNWEKSEKLVKTGTTFAKDVTLPSAEDKIYYKFVVDGNWITDHTAPQENDESGNLNNVLTTDRIIKHTPATAGIMSSVGPDSTTAELAKDVPLEKAASSDLPGSFPETPAAVDTGDFSVNPLPATDGPGNPIKLAPGEKVPDPSEFTSNTVTSGVHDDPELVAADKAKGESEPEPTFSVAPLPAFPGAVNPINVAPGEKLPDSSTLTGNTINSGVRLDKESYENSDAFGAPVLPPVVAPQDEREKNNTGVVDLPPVSKNLIPESSLPIGTSGEGTFDANPTIQSVGPQSTTAQLAGAVPLESSKVPEIVKESQKEAGVEPEASAIPEEVKEKSEVEKELLAEVPTASATSEGIGGTESTNETTAKDTPTIVKESIAESGQSPEAAANEEAVLEKKTVEKELLSEVKPENSTGEPAPKITGGLAAPQTPTKPIESREVSPGTIPGSHNENQTVPTVASGVATASTDETTPAPTTPAKSTTPADSPAEKKKKRASGFFHKIKAKFSDKKKESKE